MSKAQEPTWANSKPANCLKETNNKENFKALNNGTTKCLF